MGRSWERQQQAREAAHQLEELENEQTQLRQDASLVLGFEDLLALIPDGKSVFITPDKFVDLYHTLPGVIADEIIPALDLDKLYHGDKWQRTSVRKREDGGIAYLVDDRSTVMSTVYLDLELLSAAEHQGKQYTGGLAQNRMGLAWKTYLPLTFFRAFDELNPAEQSRVMTDPQTILKLPRQLDQVAVGQLGKGLPFSLLGFQYQQDGRTYFRTFLAESNAITRLSFLAVTMGVQ